jgi:single stranded DNA-binding protein
MSTVCIAGRLGRDAELRQGSEPTKSVVNFSVAEDIGYGDKKETQWWNCALWGARAEKIATYLTKGTPVTVVGNPKLREYDKRDGSKGHELTVRVIDVTMQGRGQERSEDPPQTLAEKSKGKPPADDFSPDSDIPFSFAYATPLLGLLLAGMGVANYVA